MQLQAHPEKGPVVLVTGGARRVGAEIVRTLHQAGYRILLHYFSSKKEAEELVAALNDVRSQSAHAIAADLWDIKAIETLVEEAVSVWGQLDHLVHNASTFFPTPFGALKPRDWDNLMGTNAKAALWLGEKTQTHLAKAQGSIVTIVDIHAQNPLKNHAIYSAAKAALLSITRSFAKDFAPAVRANAILPGAVCWPEGDNMLSVGMQEKICNETLLKRHGHPQDVAKAVLFLLESSYITGISLPVDGGRQLS